MERWIKKQQFNRFPIDFEELEFILGELVEEVLDLEHIDTKKPLHLTFSVKFNENGYLQIESIGNKFTARPKRLFKPENLSNISDQKNFVVLTIEVPIVNEKELMLNVEQNKLVISTNGGKNFRKEFLLTSSVEPRIIKSTLKNGILEVVLKKEK